MGYTHSWRRPREIDRGKFAFAITDLSTLIAPMQALGVYLAGGDGTGPAEIDSETIIFNGKGTAKYETFAVERALGREPWHRPLPDGRIYQFCKTAVLPYDLAVTAVLIILKHYLGDEFTVKTDGDQNDWTRARRLCQTHLGYGEKFVIVKTEDGRELKTS